MQSNPKDKTTKMLIPGELYRQVGEIDLQLESENVDDDLYELIGPKGTILMYIGYDHQTTNHRFLYKDKVALYSSYNAKRLVPVEDDHD